MQTEEGRTIVIQKKICLLGAFAVGKTSLIQRYVSSIFSEKYLTTLGVKIDKKLLTIDDAEVKLMIWDLAGEDEFISIRTSYLRGSSGFLFVVDGTRADTLETVKKLKEKIDAGLGALPFILLINKSDLYDQWQITDDMIDALSHAGWNVFKTSAKSGEHVDDAFEKLTNMMLEQING